jgi:hypothetical protein
MKQEELLAMKMDDQVSYWLGKLLISIGKGEFRQELYMMIDFYQRVAYERGLAAK